MYIEMYEIFNLGKLHFDWAILNIYQSLQIMSDTEQTCDREELDRELVTLTVKLLSLSQDLITTKLRLETVTKAGWMALAKARCVSQSQASIQVT